LENNTMKIRLIIVIVFLLSLIPLSNTLAQWTSDPMVNSAVCAQSTVQIDASTIDDGAGGCIISWVNEAFTILGDSIMVQRLNAAGIPQWGAYGVLVSDAPFGATPELISDGSGGAFITWEGKDSASIASNTELGDAFVQHIDHSGSLLWQKGGVIVCGAPHNQYGEQIISDGVGGVIVCWNDARLEDSGLTQTYAQRVSASGDVMWQKDGILVDSSSLLYQTFWRLVSDSAGGAIIIWTQSPTRSGDPHVFAERIDPLGNRLWSSDGVQISSSISANPAVITDGHNGAIIAWTDSRAGSREIYLQRVTASGSISWAVGGIDIGGFANAQQEPMLVEDDSGGAIVAWSAGLKNGSGIFAQKVNTSGLTEWPIDTSYKGGFRGFNICPNPTLPTGATGTYIQQTTYNIVKDGAGGAILTITDEGDGTNPDDVDIYAQRLSAGGNLLWGAQAVAVSTAAKAQSFPAVECDGDGNAIFVWQDSRVSTTNTQIYAQRVSAQGVLAPGGAIPIPILTSPPNGTVLTDTFVTLSWNNVNGATSYRLRCGTDSTFTSNLLVDQNNLSGTSYLLSGLQLSTIYYWQVSAIGNTAHNKIQIQSTPGEWSQVSSFETPVVVNSVRENGTMEFSADLYPNPATDDVSISYSLAFGSPIKIYLLNPLGETVRTICNDVESAGAHSIDVDTHSFVNGSYFIYLSAGSAHDVKRLEIVH
jgi:hypothetical protein